MEKTELLALARGMMEKGATKKEAISSWHALLAYLHLQHGNPRREVFRVLFLDKKNRLIQDSVMGTGTVDHCPVYPREVLREALLCDACALIVAHNHPSGDPSPSDADIAMTRKLRDGCEALGIVLHDSVILGDGAEYSLRANGHM